MTSETPSPWLRRRTGALRFSRGLRLEVLCTPIVSSLYSFSPRLSGAYTRSASRLLNVSAQYDDGASRCCSGDPLIVAVGKSAFEVRLKLRRAAGDKPGSILRTCAKQELHTPLIVRILRSNQTR